MKEQSCVIRKDIAEVVGVLSYCEGYIEKFGTARSII